jgi:divalent metal cation (Fe/Co/Zn/Cd) transporter
VCCCQGACCPSKLGRALLIFALQLNDVCSLLVAMQAIKLAENSSASAKYSFGWQRAEVLGALINSVFLLALCFSIGLEAIARFLNSVGTLFVWAGRAGRRHTEGLQS